MVIARTMLALCRHAGFALLLLAAQRAPAVAAGSCVDVRIGVESFYDCLNSELRQMVPGRRFSARDTPWDAATLPSPANGTFSEPAVRERLGTAFGHSVWPQRPPPPVFSAPFPSTPVR